MERKLSLQSHVMAALALAGLLFTATSFTFSPYQDAPLVVDPPQKKVQRVKVFVSADGKETKIDTVFNLPDEKMISFKVDSMLRKLDLQAGGPGNANVVIHRGQKQMRWSDKDGKNFPGREEFDILIQSGDSGMVKHQRRMIHLGDDGSFSSFGGPEGDDMMPPPPPLPPVMIHRQFGGDPFAFDAKDPSVISYDKKDIGKGLEKITIIRKKQTGQQLKKEVKVSVETSDESKK